MAAGTGSRRFARGDRRYIGAYHAAVAEVIGKFDGFVAKFMGERGNFAL
jgi:hypothetical protein